MKRKGSFSHLPPKKRYRQSFNKDLAARRQRREKKEIKYVDGWKNVAAVHALSDTADDDWSGTLNNPGYTAGNYGCLPLPAVGDDYSDRDGRKITVTSIKIKGSITWPSQEASVNPHINQPVRIVIFQDTKSNGAAPTPEKVLGGAKDQSGVVALSGDGCALYQFSNPAGWGRYKILHDKIYNPPNASTASNAANDFSMNGYARSFKINIKCNTEVNFNGTSGLIASVIDNSFHLMVATTSSANVAQLGYIARTSFIG